MIIHAMNRISKQILCILQIQNYLIIIWMKLVLVSHQIITDQQILS